MASIERGSADFKNATTASAVSSVPAEAGLPSVGMGGGNGEAGMGKLPDGATRSGEAGASLLQGSALARGVCRALAERGAATLTEFTLRTGRRADVIALDSDDRFTIVEVKTGPADFRADSKWSEYLDFCDRFYFAVPESFPRELLPGDQGVMVADPYDALILRPAAERPMNPARRRALILRFARAAAQCVDRLRDPR